MKNIFVLVLMTLMVISCNNANKTNEQIEFVTLKEETLPPVQPLKLEKVDLPEDYTMGNSTCLIYQDTILVVLKDGDTYPLTHMLTLVNMGNGERIGEYFTRGQGPNELLSAIPRFSHNCLDIYCYTTGKLIPFNIDSAIMYGNDYKPNIIYHSKNDFNEWCSMDDTLFLTTNQFYLGCKEFKENAKLPEFYWYDKNGKITPEYMKPDYKKIKMAIDVTGSTISINKNKNRVVCCYKNQPYIKIFDLNLNLKKQILGPEPDDGKYVVMEDFDRIYFDTRNYGVNSYYNYATCDSDNIFVINDRQHKKKQKGAVEIFKLDWDGNVIGRYSANGKSIYSYNYSKNSNALYLWVIEDGEKCMYKAKLD